MKNNCTLEDKILYICRYEYSYFLNKENVFGVGLGFQVKNGFYTCNKCIKVFVANKVPLNKISIKDLIPPYYKGIPTDVVERGRQSAYSFNKKSRPVLCGYNIGPEKYSASGTMGCLVTDGKKIYCLSNNHVLADEGTIPLGTNILQPCYVLGGKPVQDAIGKLSKYIKLKPNTVNNNENIVDCAIAEIVDKSLVSSAVALIGKIKGISNPKLGQTVQKVGATTELTKGKITELGSTLILDLYRGSYLFKNQIITTGMAKEGDSGSILFDDNMNAMGLLMSGDDSETTCNPIMDVLSNLGVKIIA